MTYVYEKSRAIIAILISSIAILSLLLIASGNTCIRIINYDENSVGNEFTVYLDNGLNYSVILDNKTNIELTIPRNTKISSISSSFQDVQINKQFDTDFNIGVSDIPKFEDLLKNDLLVIPGHVNNSFVDLGTINLSDVFDVQYNDSDYFMIDSQKVGPDYYINLDILFNWSEEFHFYKVLNSTIELDYEIAYNISQVDTNLNIHDGNIVPISSDNGSQVVIGNSYINENINGTQTSINFDCFSLDPFQLKIDYLNVSFDWLNESLVFNPNETILNSFNVETEIHTSQTINNSKSKFENYIIDNQSILINSTIIKTIFVNFDVFNYTSTTKEFVLTEINLIKIILYEDLDLVLNYRTTDIIINNISVDNRKINYDVNQVYSITCIFL